MSRRSGWSPGGSTAKDEVVRPRSALGTEPPIGPQLEPKLAVSSTTLAFRYRRKHREQSGCALRHAGVTVPYKALDRVHRHDGRICVGEVPQRPDSVLAIVRAKATTEIEDDLQSTTSGKS